MATDITFPIRERHTADFLMSWRLLYGLKHAKDGNDKFQIGLPRKMLEGLSIVWRHNKLFIIIYSIIWWFSIKDIALYIRICKNDFIINLSISECCSCSWLLFNFGMQPISESKYKKITIYTQGHRIYGLISWTPPTFNHAHKSVSICRFEILKSFATDVVPRHPTVPESAANQQQYPACSTFLYLHQCLVGCLGLHSPGKFHITIACLPLPASAGIS